MALYHYNITEIEAASMFGTSLQSIRLWRRSGKIPDYLYSSLCGENNVRYNVRYCEALLVRWRAAQNEGLAATRTEELLAREELANQLDGLYAFSKK